ncbi:hypothetical protein Bca4012_008967 [Brassica carinata]
MATDINYTKTMESLGSYRREKDEKKLERNSHSSSYHPEKESRSHYPPRGGSYDTPIGSRLRSPPRSVRRDEFSRDASSALMGNRGRELTPSRRNPIEMENKSRSLGSKSDVPLPRLPTSQRLSHGHGNVRSRLGERVWVEKAPQSQISHTPPPRPPREPMVTSQEVNYSLKRRPALERISLPVARNLLPDGDDQSFHMEPATQERVPALQRLTPPTEERIPLLLNGAANSKSG